MRIGASRPLVQGDLEAALPLLNRQSSTAVDTFQVQSSATRPSSSESITSVQTEALDTLKGLMQQYGEVHGLDVEVRAKQLSGQVGQSLRELFTAVQDLKARGQLEDVEQAQAMSPALLNKLSEPGLPDRVKQRIYTLAGRDLTALVAHPTKNRDLRDLLHHELTRRYGVKPSSLDQYLPPPDLKLRDRNAQQQVALSALLHDPKLSPALAEACLYQLGKVGNASALPVVQDLAQTGKTTGVRQAAQVAQRQIQKAQKMTIVLVSMEVKPFTGPSGGGLGNVMKELPRALANQGHRVVVVTPRHAVVDRNTLEDTGLTGRIESPLADEPFQILRKTEDIEGEGSLEICFVENGKYFSDNRTGLYGDKNGDYGDNPERYDFLSAAAPQVIKKVLGDDAPDVIQVNDAHTGPAAAYIQSDDHFDATKVVMAVHNLGAAYQGRIGPDRLQNMMFQGMDDFYPMGPAEFHGDVNLLKYGMTKADGVITVSRAYMQEILSEDQGEGLHGVLRHLEAKDQLWGNLNGIDNSVWNPATDEVLPAKFSYEDQSGKAECKAHLQQRFGLEAKPETPVVGVLARLAEQKGWDDVIRSVEATLDAGRDVQYVMVGSGDPKLVAQLEGLAAKYPGKVAFDSKFTSEKEHLIYGGGDFFLMPSKFEPCGLPQMYALRYGTVPIVRAVGGLEESIQDYGTHAKGNGFKFTEDVVSAMDRALDWYGQGSESRQGLLRNCFLSDFSWENSSAVEQLAFYREIINS